MSVAIPIRRGATLTLPLDFFTDTTETIPVNLTGSTLSVVESTFPTNPSITVLNAVGGNTQLSLTSTLTNLLVLNRNYVLSIQQVQPSGAIVINGPLTFVALDQ